MDGFGVRSLGCALGRGDALFGKQSPAELHEMRATLSMRRDAGEGLTERRSVTGFEREYQNDGCVC